MTLTEETLKKLLVEPGFITPERLESDALEAKRRDESLERRLIASGAITAENLGRTIAEYAGCEFANLADIKLSPASVRPVLPALPHAISDIPGTALHSLYCVSY